MSRPPRAEFCFRGDLYVALAEWAAPGLELPGYERVEAVRAREIFASLPPSFARHPGVRVMLAGAGSRAAGLGGLVGGSRERTRLVLFRRARLVGQALGPEPEAEVYVPPPEPEPPPLLDLRVELAGQAAIAATLLAAAANGAPFCEKCENCG